MDRQTAERLWQEASTMEVPEPNGFGTVVLRFNEADAVRRFANLVEKHHGIEPEPMHALEVNPDLLMPKCICGARFYNDRALDEHIEAGNRA